MNGGTKALLSVRGLRTTFSSAGRTVTAVDGVSFEIRECETLALVGESGCGKSATALSLLQLIPSPPGRIEAGEAVFGGRNLLALPAAEIRKVRGKEIAMVFQDPMSSLNPVYTMGKQVAEAVLAHRRVSKKAAMAEAVRLLEQVGLPDAGARASAFPHQLSGGMRQRVMIAMALAGEPKLLIADEPTTAIDATVQAQVIALLRRIQRERRMALLLITHDMGVVAELADRIGVFYAGQIVEEGPAEAIFDRPLHPYTQGLFASLPRFGKPKEPLQAIPGEPLRLTGRIEGCRFRGRCPLEIPACAQETPTLREVAPDRRSACLRVSEGRLPEPAREAVR